MAFAFVLIEGANHVSLSSSLGLSCVKPQVIPEMTLQTFWCCFVCALELFDY